MPVGGRKPPGGVKVPAGVVNVPAGNRNELGWNVPCGLVKVPRGRVKATTTGSLAAVLGSCLALEALVSSSD